MALFILFGRKVEKEPETNFVFFAKRDDGGFPLFPAVVGEAPGDKMLSHPLQVSVQF